VKNKKICIYCGKRIKRRKCKCMKRKLRKLAKQLRIESNTRKLGLGK